MNIRIKPKHMRFIIQILALVMIIFTRDTNGYIIGGVFLLYTELANILEAIENIKK